MNPSPRSKLATTITKGVVSRREIAGAGGWGDPLERDPALVLKDVLNDFATERAAREDYGVVLGGTPLTVDEVATAALRQRTRAARKWAEVQAYSRGKRLAAFD